MLNPHDFFFELPLYTEIEIIEKNEEEFYNLVNEIENVDGYNPKLKENTTYKISRDRNQSWPHNIDNHLGYCSATISKRNKIHSFCF